MSKRETITDINFYRNRRKKNKSFRWILIPLFLVACLFTGYFFAISNFFALEKIIILGNNSVSDEEILLLSHLEKGINIFSINESNLQECLSIIPLVQTIEIQRIIPHSLKIIITERQSIALINVVYAIIEIDNEGRILNRCTYKTQQELPLISGLDLENQGLVPGCYLKSKNLDKALEILSLIPEEAEKIGEVNVKDPELIKLYTFSGIEVRLGDGSNFEEKYLLYSTIIAENQDNEGKAINYIDVGIVDKPAFTYK